MTISEAIDLIDLMVPNQYSDEDKIAWLSDLDLQIYHELHLTHEGNVVGGFVGYPINVDRNTELLVPAPYAQDIYLHHLQAKIAFQNREIGDFNAAATLFNAVYQRYENRYHATHMPLSSGGTRFRF